MSSLSDIFGGTQSSASTQTYPTMSVQQQAALNALINRLQGPTSPGVKTSLAALEQQAMSQASGDTPTNAAIASLDKIMQTAPQDIQPYYKATVEDPMLRDFQQRVLPMITQRFSGQAGFGSDRINAENLALQDLTNSLTSSRANISYQAYQDALNKRLAAAQSIPGAQSSNVSNILSVLGGQLQPNQQNIQDILSALSIKPFENITTVTPGQAGMLQGIAPGLGKILPFLGQMFSGAGGWLSGLLGGAAGSGVLSSTGTDIMTTAAAM